MFFVWTFFGALQDMWVGATQSQRKYEKTLENMHLKLKTNLTQYVYERTQDLVLGIHIEI